MNQPDNNSGALDNTALAGVRRLAAAFTGGEEKPDATKVAFMFMATSQIEPGTGGLTGGYRLISPEAIAQCIDTLQSMNAFFNEMVEALDALKEMKPPQVY